MTGALAAFEAGCRTRDLHLFADLYCHLERATWRNAEGLIALGRIHDYADGVVFRHEQTLTKPRADRLNLLRATRAHFGQIFMLYSDPQNEIAALLQAKTEQEPETSVLDEYETLHRLWRVDHPAIIPRSRPRCATKSC